MMHRLVSILLGTAPLWLAGAALAQATPEGAAALQKGLTGILTPTLATAGLGEPIFEGGWTVEPAGAGYRVTGPALSLALRDDDYDGRKQVVRIRCDGDRYTATAGEGAVYRLSGETPVRCEIRPGGGEPPVLFTSRSRRAELTVDLAASLLTASTDESEGVTVTEDGETQLAVHRLSLTSATTPHPGSKQQDIALQFEAEGLSAGDPAAGEGMTLGRLRYGGRLEDVDAAALRDRVWRLIAFTLDAAQRDPQAPQPPNAGRKLDALLRQVQGLIGSASQAELVLTDLRGAGDDTTTGFESLTLAGGYRGLDRAVPGRGLGGDVTLDLRGLTVADGPGKTDPGTLSIDRVRLVGHARSRRRQADRRVDAGPRCRRAVLRPDRDHRRRPVGVPLRPGQGPLRRVGRRPRHRRPDRRDRRIPVDGGEAWRRRAAAGGAVALVRPGPDRRSPRCRSTRPRSP